MAHRTNSGIDAFFSHERTYGGNERLGRTSYCSGSRRKRRRKLRGRRETQQTNSVRKAHRAVAQDGWHNGAQTVKTKRGAAATTTANNDHDDV